VDESQHHRWRRWPPDTLHWPHH